MFTADTFESVTKFRISYNFKVAILLADLTWGTLLKTPHSLLVCNIKFSYLNVVNSIVLTMNEHVFDFDKPRTSLFKS